MPLRDHFHPPLADLYPWEAFHAAWATANLHDELTCKWAKRKLRELTKSD